MSEETLTVVVQRRQEQGNGVLVLDLASADGRALPAFEAGAHVDVHLADGLVRQYSLAGSPAERGTYRLGILRDPASRGGSEAAHAQLRAADLIVIRVPVYKASYPGAFKHFLDLIDPKALEGKAAILLATGGSDQHALILEHQLRALTSYLGLYSAPKTLFARDSDFTDHRLANPAIAERVALVAAQARRLLRAPAAPALAEAA